MQDSKKECNQKSHSIFKPTNHNCDQHSEISQLYKSGPCMLGVTNSHINEFKVHLVGKNPFLVLKIQPVTMAGKGFRPHRRCYYCDIPKAI